MKDAAAIRARRTAPARHVGCAAILSVALFFLGCENGYELGPLERDLRTAFNGWDMWETPAVRPYESPLTATPDGTVPRSGLSDLDKGRADAARLDKADRKKRAALSYRRYCHHCHGPNGDGRIIVGESLETRPADLRSVRVQAKTDEALFDHIQRGGELMLPLAATLSPLEMLLTIEYLRTLEKRPSTPHFKPKFTEPIR